MASSLKFGTSGLRGLATELVGDESARYAAAFVAHLSHSGALPREMLIGQDLRASSAAIATSVIGAIRGAGVAALDCGRVSTPALALEALRRGAPAIMVTGSHIPADRNGLKFYTATGEIEKADEAGILMALGPIVAGGSEATMTLDDVDARYLKRTQKLLAPDALSGRRIGVWQHSSVSRDLLVEALEGFGAVVIALGRSDVFISVDTEAVSAEARDEIAGWVKEHRLDALVSTDGDGDRPLMADETGALVRGDIIGLLTGHFVGAEVAVTPVTSSSAIEASSYFGQVVRTRVGSPFVIAGMADAIGRGQNAIVGFEANGGVLLGSDFKIGGEVLAALPTRDALLAILSVLGAAEQAGRTLSQLMATLPSRVARSDRLEDVEAERSARLMRRLETDAAGFFGELGPITAISTIDGMRFTLASGDVIHYRPSGNAPELRCYTEAANAARADELLEWGLSAAEGVVR